MPQDLDNYSISILREIEYPLWDEFVADSPQGSYFNTTQWAEILASVFKRKYQILVCYKNKQIVAGILFFVNKKFMFKMITPVALYPYNGPIFYRPVDEKYQKTINNQLEILKRIITFLKKHFTFFVLNTSFLLQDMRAFQWAECSVEPIFNYIIDLEKNGNLSTRYNQSVRKKIRQAETLNPEIIESEDFNTLIDLYIASYRRHKVKPLISEKELFHFFKKAISLAQIRLFYVKLDGKITSGRVIVIDKNTVFDLLAGGVDTRGLGATYLLNYILQNVAAGHKYFDFLGAAHEQVEQFKRGFGGDLLHGFRISSPAKFPISNLVRIRFTSLKRRRIS